MTTHGKSLLMQSCMGLLVCASATHAGTVFIDDFERASWDQGGPVTWARFADPWGAGTIEIRDGSLLVTPSPDVSPYPSQPQYHETDLRVLGELYHDVDVRTTIRALGNSSLYWAGVGALETGTSEAPSDAGLFGYLNSSGRLQIHAVYGSGPDGGRELVSINTGLNMQQYDVNLRLQIEGGMAHLSAWRDGAAEPDVPQLTAHVLPSPLGNADHLGQVMLWAGSSGSVFPFAFREFEVIPEPSTVWLVGLGAVAMLWSTRAGRRRNK